ncbi:sulfate/molybdate ABC transporter ATP-binding protein [Sphingomonas nostoxanthinifaciens]|uniref:sulfate/molybdate ABC transporter ATP-binding protein n=1 Tax=Sphingomonas nostoxanthinifaciens TaxID=2872652 RepID=UPI001CC1D092|nr:sulfate/molybdate ABC transporter ATP-binding protein [Sphingomonas nostoxanthinifaciens]
MTAIAVQNVARRFGRFAALTGVDLDIRSGEFLALLGPSGSGKTTLLRILAGLDFADEGAVLFDGEDVSDVPIAQRKVGFVFQQYALFRHMTVADNIAFGLTVRKRRERPSKPEIRARVDELLRLVQLEGLGGRFPAQLSGGQRQRVALARALAVEPRILLLDEPFGALDAKVRKDLRRWLRELHDRVGLTSIFVTHDQEEAIELADRVVVVNHGRIEQVATPQTLYAEPASAFVYDFVGESNQFAVQVEGGGVLRDGRRLPLNAGTTPNGAARLFFRPHDVRVVEDGTGISGRVTHVRPLGAMQRVEAEVAGTDRPLELDLADAAIQPGAAISVLPTRFALFPG